MDAYNNCKEFRGHIDKYPELIEYAKTLEGLLSSYGVHAAGIVVSDTPLASIAPMRLAKTKKDGTRDLATQYANEDLEYLGLIKFDILALSTLSVVSLALKYIKKFENIDIDIENLPLDDDKTFELYRSGNLIGVFQCEERGMQKTMQEIGVDSFNDIVAGIALFRPGPMASIPKYCARKHGQEHVDYYSPEIEPFVKPYLEDTYGILSYQEQIMQICNSLAGLTITDGYVIIKAVGKKKEDLLRKYRLKFIDGCENNGVGRRIATEYWDKFITPFAAYGFNKCLDGSTEVVDCRLNKTYTLEDLSKRYKKECIDNIYLHSLDQGEVVEDKIVDVFCTGEKEVYEVEFDDGSIAKCTLDHKFMCDDGEFRTVKNIVKDNLSVTQYFMEELRSTEVNKKLKIKSIKKIGTRKTYNITMNSDQHNYFISTGSNRSIVTKNSHSACYGVLSYQTAYLKAHYPDLFMMAYLNVECRNKKYEKVEHLEREVSRMGIEIGKRHINKCELDYELVKTELPNGISISRITPSIMCKGLATTAAESIVKNKPYKSLEDFAIRTDSASVDSEAFSSLMAAGIIKQDESSLNKFNQFRSHLKKVRKKGYQGMDLFG
jgi:DNA polymerase-3 subunit alpha